MNVYFAVIVSIFFLIIMLIAIFDPDPADAKKSKYMIQLCCTWEDSLDDDELPFSIKKGNADLTKIVQLFLTGRNI